MSPLNELYTKIHSMPHNLSIIKFFRYAKLGENAHNPHTLFRVKSLPSKHHAIKNKSLIFSATYFVSKMRTEPCYFLIFHVI